MGSLLSKAASVRSAIDALDSKFEASVDLAVQQIQRCISSGGKILIFGNGGSAADSQHFAAELVSSLHGAPLPSPIRAIALTTDTSIITAIGNDVHFSEVFARQVTAFCDSGDVVFGLSTSGRSTNVIKGLRAATELGGTSVAITGKSGPSAAVADIEIRIPSNDTQDVQALTLIVLHAICEDLEALREPLTESPSS